MKKFYVFRGLPGSGKTTLAKKTAQFVVESDMFRYDDDNHYVFDSRRNREVTGSADDLRDFMIRKLGVNRLAVTSAFTKLSHMAKSIEAAKSAGYDVTVVECRTSYKNVHGVPDDVVKRMAAEFEPLSEEAAARMGVRVVRIYKDEDERKL